MRRSRALYLSFTLFIQIPFVIASEIRKKALIRAFEPDSPHPTGVHQPVRCTYFTFTGMDGQSYLQFKTYGSPGRRHPSIPSQTIQLDRNGMTQLAQILLQALEPEREA